MDCYLTAAPTRSSTAFSFEENFDITGQRENFKTSPDGQVWYLFLDKEKGVVIRVVYGWLQMCSDLDAGRSDELDFGVSGQSGGQPYTSNKCVHGMSGRQEMRHMLWFVQLDFHDYVIL
ncbi:hypothetical protein HPP92_009901 [Vanilla planifolia]|uniref:Uncharacterized protein n=1 Tax=Vanilla planifolia TaxID=51239 RepID=A0A835R890_VANPL|nr:hypothetical protein HPP92_009901 [Vanilla planifolia]